MTKYDPKKPVLPCTIGRENGHKVKNYFKYRDCIKCPLHHTCIQLRNFLEIGEDVEYTELRKQNELL